MEWLTENLDILTTAPIAVILLVYMYLSNGKVTKLIDNMQKTIDRLIDKIQ